MLEKSVLALVLMMFILGATLIKKDTPQWGTVEPCTQAIEDIAEVVNERLYAHPN